MGIDSVSVAFSKLLRSRAAAIGTVLLPCLVWSYWATIRELCGYWASDDDYSVGMLVPFVALFLFWRDHRAYGPIGRRICWWGLAAILAAQACRFFGLYFYYGSIERYSLVLTFAGVVLLIAGPSAFWRLRWILAFLLLMIPFPHRIHGLISLPLQGLSTSMSAFALELCGFFVVRDGNVLQLNDRASIAVTEACSGLRMLMAFIFVSSVFAFVIRRSPWQKGMLIMSSIPVAIVSNAVRIFGTGVFACYVESESAVEVFHDYAGLAMMPLALLLIIGELRLMDEVTNPKGPCHPGAVVGSAG